MRVEVTMVGVHDLKPEIRQILLRLAWGFGFIPSETGAGREAIRLGLARDCRGFLSLTDLGRRAAEEFLDGYLLDGSDQDGACSESETKRRLEF